MTPRIPRTDKRSRGHGLATVSIARTRVVIVAVVIAVCVSSGHAQTFGAPTPGLCFLSREQVLDRSLAGAAANQRLSLFRESVEHELARERGAIAADVDALQIQRPVISEAVYQQRAGALALRRQSFQTLEATRDDQIARTRLLVTQKIIGETARVLASLIAVHGCSAVLEATGAYAINPRMNLTPEVIRALDARLPPLNFDLQPVVGR